MNAANIEIDTVKVLSWKEAHGAFFEMDFFSRLSPLGFFSRFYGNLFIVQRMQCILLVYSQSFGVPNIRKLYVYFVYFELYVYFVYFELYVYFEWSPPAPLEK